MIRQDAKSILYLVYLTGRLARLATSQDRCSPALYALVDMVNGDNRNMSSIRWNSIAHGDIKPLNILLRFSVTGRLEIVLIDYGTCGPDQVQGGAINGCSLQ